MRRFHPSTERLTFARPCGGRLQIGPLFFATLAAYIQDRPHKPEAGGVLLGRHILDCSDVIVDSVTTPMQGDRRSRHRFRRGKRRHQEIIDQAWRASEGACTYLGEWHSHPEPFPTPSIIDRFDWARKLLVDRFAAPMFFVIVGISEVRVWEGRRHGLPIRLSQVREAESPK